MPKKKIEVYNKDELIYPYIESDHVTFSNGMKVGEMLNQSISMPTVAHEDLSFKVGVGDQDVSSAIVNSSVAKMTIKGKTYQNILPEPSTHVLTNNKEMFKVNEGLDANVEIVDGVSKSAILKGQTLVNVLSKTELSDGTVNIPTIPIDKTGGYTLFAYGDLTQNLQFNFMGYNSNGEHILNCLVHVSELATPKYFANFRDSSSDSVAEIRYRDRASEEGTPIKYVLLKGDYTNAQIPYFTGMQSVKMPVLKTTGKNLFDVRSIDNAEYDGAYRYVKIPIKRNTTYTFSLDKTLCFGYVNIAYRTTPWGGGELYWVCHPDATKKDVITFTNTIYDFLYINWSENNTDLPREEYMGLFRTFQLEEGSTATSYEPYKTNILSAPEDVELCGVGDIKDTLNCNTGEYIKRINSIVLDESGKIMLYGGQIGENTLAFRFSNLNINPKWVGVGTKPNLLCTMFPTITYNESLGSNFEDKEGICLDTSNGESTNAIVIRILKSRLISEDVAGIRDFISKTKIDIVSEAESPVIKTVDLSSSGNWDMITLNGSEEGIILGNLANRFFVPIGDKMYYSPSEVSVSCSSFGVGTANTLSSGQVCAFSASSYYKGLMFSMSNISTVDEFKKYLKSNPMTIVYKLNDGYAPECGFAIFSNGHIIQSSGADSSLIPTLDYQAKTSNSYVMDLMKTNTRYTMKAKSASGTFTIDGTSYGAGTNGTFTTPSSMTNKFLVMSNKTNEEVMILEGDVVQKAIPYFKGIKSAFEGKDKIEVLSTGKNLFDRDDFTKRVLSLDPSHSLDGNILSYFTNATHDKRLIEGIFKENTQYTITYEIEIDRTQNFSVCFMYIDGSSSYVDMSKASQISENKYVFKYTSSANKTIDYFCTSYGHPTRVSVDLSKIQLEESPTPTTYEPCKSNIAKIPLLSPLRSLPNGVCDELIIDRENNKAKIIQRIGKAMALETPVITEVDLEGFPYIYKNGHIFLNSEIAPTTEITYSINQCQQISASNEDIIRHEKELTYLQKLIAQYIQVDYESVLLSLKV